MEALNEDLAFHVNSKPQWVCVNGCVSKWWTSFWLVGKGNPKDSTFLGDYDFEKPRNEPMSQEGNVIFHICAWVRCAHWNYLYGMSCTVLEQHFPCSFCTVLASQYLCAANLFKQPCATVNSLHSALLSHCLRYARLPKDFRSCFCVAHGATSTLPRCAPSS